MIKKFIGLFDIHYPSNIKLSCVESFMKDLKPDILIYGGDTWDCDPLSHWGEEKRFKELGLENIRKQLNKEATGLHNLLKHHISISKAKEVHYLIGNHENWINLYQNKYGNAMEPITLDSLTNISKLGIKIYEQGKALKIGKLYFLHGDRISKSGNINVAKTAVSWYQAPVLFGHYHSTQSFGNVSPVQVTSPQVGQLVGCLTSNNPDYNKNKPNACINQFVYGYIDTKTGLFNYYLVTIIRDRFILNGKVYK
jgi:hypothetical protein